MQRAWLILCIVAAGLGVWWWSTHGTAPSLQDPSAGVVQAAPREDPQVSRAPVGGPQLVEADLRHTATPAEIAVRVAVQVLGPDGDGMPFVDVGLGAAGDGNRRSEFRQMSRTDAAGAAHFVVPAGAGRAVELWCGLGAAATATLPSATEVTLQLRCRARLFAEGVVVDAQGQGVPDARLVLLPWDERGGPGLPCALSAGSTRQDGSFRVALACGGRLGAVHPAFAPSSLRVVQPDPDRAAPPTTVTLRFLLLSAQAHVSGLVIDSAGVPVAGANLELRPRDGRGGELAGPPQRVRSGSDGTFSATDLRPGPTLWAARADGFGTATGSLTTQAGDNTGLCITLTAAAAVHGTVRDARAEPVGGVLIATGRPGTFAYEQTHSGPDGTFRLTCLPAGPIDLLASEPERNGVPARRLAARLELRAGAVTPWDPTLPDAPTGPLLRGIVVDADDAPLAGWRVTAVQGTAAPKMVATDSQGTFVVELPGQGVVDVLVHAPDQPMQTFPEVWRPGIDPGAGSGAEPVRIVVGSGAPVTALCGTVRSAQQAPLAASVTVWHRGMRRTARTTAGTDGTFRVERVPPGTVDVSIELPGNVAANRFDLPVTGGPDTDLGVIELGLAAAIHGTVTGPDGQPPEQLEVFVMTKEQRLVAEYSGGTYRIGSLPPGRHELQVQGRGVAAATFPIEVPAGVELQQDLQLQAGVPRRFVVQAPAAAGSYLSFGLRRADGAHQWISGQARRDAASLEFVAWMAPGNYEAVAWGAEGWVAKLPVEFPGPDDTPTPLVLQKTGNGR